MKSKTGRRGSAFWSPRVSLALASALLGGCAMGEDTGDWGPEAAVSDATDGTAPADSSASHDTGTDAHDAGTGEHDAAPPHDAGTDARDADAPQDVVLVIEAGVDVPSPPDVVAPDAGGCVPTLPSGAHEDNDALCSDGVDNDCNGHADCDDFYCSRFTPSVTVCRDGGTPDVVSPPDASVDASGPCSAVLVVNEVQTAGAGGAADEFVELYNAAGCAASLAGWTLRYTSATGTTASVHWTGAAGDSIGARGFAVVAGAGFTGSSLGTLSGGTSGALAAAAGGIGLFAPDGTRVDSVGYGATATTPLIEGAAAPAPASGATIGRIPDGRDTDDNSVDLQLTTRPTPNAANR